MIAHFDYLQLFAQLYIAIAGFAGIIAAFGTFNIAPEVITFRVRFLVTVALFGLIMSLLPAFPSLYGAPETDALRISSLLFAMGFFGIVIATWRILSPLYKTGLIHTQMFSAVLYFFAFCEAIALIVVAAGLLPQFAWGIYLSGLLYGLVLCSNYFVMMMFSADIGKGR